MYSHPTMIKKTSSRDANMLILMTALITMIQDVQSFALLVAPCSRGIMYKISRCKETSLFSSLHRSSEFNNFHEDDRDEHDDNNNGPRRPEFDIFQDEPSMSQEQRNVRKLRLERENDIENSFLPYGNELWALHRDIYQLSEKLIEDLSSNGGAESRNIRAKLRELEAKDANIVYGMELDRMDEAIGKERFKDAEKHGDMARRARSHLAQFNLEGLWVGKYGDHGFEMINVTYVGDTLIARKVTGDKNVPAGEITFQVDFSPTRHSTAISGIKDPPPHPKEVLPNIVLSEEAAKRWENKELQRFHGVGHVAEEGFQNSQWFEGQMVLINKEYFSFAWLPISHQIFFGRPSPELSLTMMQESMNKKTSFLDHDNNVNDFVNHITRCFESTAHALVDGSLEDYSDSCIIIDDDDNLLCFE